MKPPVDLYSSYADFGDRTREAVRRETYGTDIGQNSWTTAEEYERIARWLALTPDADVLEVASGAGGPALHLARLTGCHVTGVDVNEHGIATSAAAADAAGLVARVTFRLADATRELPFEDAAFGALLCVDALNHLPDRRAVFGEWWRVLRPGGRAFFTDPVVVTGLVTQDEFALRSSIGRFVFAPAGLNERLAEAAGFRLVHVEDLSEPGARVAGRWRDARARHRDALVRLEGEERYEGLQRFLDAVHRLMGEQRLSRIGYVLERPAGAVRP